MNNTLHALFDRAQLNNDELVNNNALKSMAQELSKRGVSTTREGDSVMMVHKNFLLGGKASSVGWVSTLWRDLIANLVNLDNKNRIFFAINADEGRVDVGFNLEGLVPAGQDAINMRFNTNIEWLRAMLINADGDGMLLRKTWFDEVGPSEYAQINCSDSLAEVAFGILEAKALKIIEEEANVESPADGERA